MTDEISMPTVYATIPSYLNVHLSDEQLRQLAKYIIEYTPKDK
jgi:hypothetical protein